MTRPAALREKSETELLTMERDLVQQLYKFRFQTATGAMENPARVSQVKREIARIKTVLRERELKSEQSQ
jgi:large subunit ribosomal protein L29